MATHHEVPVSVIIVARNEKANLQTYLESVLNQEYSDYEVIVVNNGSWDASQELLEDLEEQYPKLRVLKILEQDKYPKGKKFGLTLGIKAARNEWLLLTDSDCKPLSSNWIKTMQKHFGGANEIVLGYSPYFPSNSLLNLFIRFETFQTALLYLSFALRKQPYMGVGRNLAYKKSLFFSVKGFAAHNHILSGDDDLFVNQTANTENVTICVNPEAFVGSKPKTTFADWLKQKKRHWSTGKYYKGKDKIKLGLFNSANQFFYLFLIAACFFSPVYWWPIVLIGIRYALLYACVSGAAIKLREKSLLYFLPFLDFFYFLYYFRAAAFALFNFRKQRDIW